MSFFSSRRLLIGISWLVVAFGQPEFSVVLALAAASVGFALFWAAICDQKGRFWKGCVWFSTVSAVHLSWLASPLYQGYYIIAVYAALCIWLGLQFGCLCLLIKKKRITERLFLIASLWTLFELGRFYVLCGYAWHPVGITLGSNLYSAQLAWVGGVLFLSFWVVLTNVCALMVIKGSREAVLAWVLLSIFPYCFGAIRLAGAKKKSEMISAYLVQPAWLPDEKNDALGEEQLVSPERQWLRLLEKIESLDKKPDYLILPEAAFPYGYRVNGHLAQQIADQSGVEVIVGLDVSEGEKNYNAAFHFVRNKEPQRYAKRVLLPLAEALPFEMLRPLVARYGIAQFFTPGKEQIITGEKRAVALSVCYEECFPHVMIDAKKKGGQMMVNVSNDGWYAFSRLPAVHFHHARLRTIELGLPLIRASNTGYSAALDCFGRISALFKESYVCQEEIVHVSSATTTSLFAKWGHAFILALCSISLGVTILRLSLKKYAVKVLH